MSGELMRRPKAAGAKVLRCPLHGSPLERRARRFIDPALIAGRRTAFQRAEREAFPFAGVYVMCRNGPFSGASCPQCRAALLEWCRTQSDDDGLQEAMLEAMNS